MGRNEGQISIFYCGIIDMLQLYNVSKKGEHLLKSWVLRKDEKGISAVPPDEYMDRFMEKMNAMWQSSADN